MGPWLIRPPLLLCLDSYLRWLPVDHILPYLFLLACPVSMGVMMWMMMRKDHGHASPPVSDPRVAELESQVNELRMAIQERPGGGGAQATDPAASADKS